MGGGGGRGGGAERNLGISNCIIFKAVLLRSALGARAGCLFAWKPLLFDLLACYYTYNRLLV